MVEMKLKYICVKTIKLIKLNNEKKKEFGIFFVAVVLIYTNDKPKKKRPSLNSADICNYNN